MSSDRTIRPGNGSFVRDHFKPILIITILSILLMLPRILSAQYGLLDDGMTFIAGQEMVAGTWGLDWKAGSGRFRPMYWIFNAAVMLLFPENAAGAFCINTAVLILSNLIIYWIVFHLFRNTNPALFSALFFLFSGPIIETFYTISKAEHFQVLCILLSIFFMMKASGSRVRRNQIGMYLAAFLAITAAMLTKETSVVMVPMTIGWLLLAWILKRWEPEYEKQITPRIIFAGITALSGAIFWLMRIWVIGFGSSENSYAGKVDLSVDRIVSSTIRMSGWIIRDFPQMVFWGSVIVLLLLIRKKYVKLIGFFPDILLWILGWFGIFLPWGNTQEYYLLPFAAGAAILSGLLGWEIISNNGGLFRKISIIRASLIVMGFGFFFITLLHNYTSARIQLIVDRENARMVDFLAVEVPENGYVFHGFSGDLEYAHELLLHLHWLNDRSDITVDEFKFQTAADLNVDELVYYVPIPTSKNRVRLSVRVGTGTMAHLHSELQNFSDVEMESVYSSHDSFRVFHLDIFQVGCRFFPGKEYCDNDYPLLDRRVFAYGWDIEKVYSP